MKRIINILFLAMALTSIAATASAQAKHQFRGAWIQCVNGQFQGMGTERMQQTLTEQLDALRAMGVNAIIFQVRPECDALYPSNLEPWSRFLTGQQGKAPAPYWDPLGWMVDQCHARGMELHAWINPYRAKTKGTAALSVNHVAVKHPEWCFEYDGMTLLNPALKECRDYICQVAADIVTRYDVDGLHIDDYFYPYPVAGKAIPDDQQYRMTATGVQDRGDWRRNNVNLFVKQLYETVHQAKPWVKVGISPFGIYRNSKSSQIGSKTNGLQNYDDLYADILLWVNQGWLDYCVPQIYWEIGNKAADYQTLVDWWARYASARPLYIGEDIERTVKAADPANASTHQQGAKERLKAAHPEIQGTVLWYAKAAVDNPGNYATMLRQAYWRTPALQPCMPHIDKKAPGKPRRVKALNMSDGNRVLCWTEPKAKQWNDQAHTYAVYRFAKGEKVDTDDASHLIAVTNSTFMQLPKDNSGNKFTYVVTAVDRMGNESKGKKVTIK